MTNPILYNLVLVYNIEFYTLYWKAFPPFNMDIDDQDSRNSYDNSQSDNMSNEQSNTCVQNSCCLDPSHLEQNEQFDE